MALELRLLKAGIMQGKVPMYKLSCSCSFFDKHPQMVTARQDIKSLPDVPKGIFDFIRKTVFKRLS